MKKQIISTLMMSTLALSASQGVVADEIVIGENAPVISNLEEVVENASNELTIGQTDVVSPLPETDVVGDEGTVIGSVSEPLPTVLPVDGGIVTPSEEVVAETPLEIPTEETVETVSSGITVGEDSALVEEPKPSEENFENVVNTSEGGADTSVTPINKPNQEEIKKAEENTGVSATGQAQAVTIPVIETPIVTNTGVTIVGTQDGQVIVQTDSGAVEIKSAESIGAVKQADGTVAIKDSEGKVQVLPSTGENSSAIVTTIGILTLLGTVAYAFRDKLKSKFKK